MKVIDANNLPESQVVKFGTGVSNRILLEKDGTGYTLTQTTVYPGDPAFWHYKDHIESCYCVSGHGVLECARTGERHQITPGITYVLDDYDAHYFEAYEETVLVCVFNPPLRGPETHGEDGSYSASYKSPVYDVRSVPIDKVTANDYNPNSVAPPEMELLETSIWEDGYTQPIVTVRDYDSGTYVVVDGFHRYLTLKNSKRINERENGMLPVVVLDKDVSDRMASTIRHNRARGTHNIELMSTIVSELVDMGKGDAWICRHIGMSKDELLRLKQITGIAALFQNEEFSKSWNAVDQDEKVLDEATV